VLASEAEAAEVSSVVLVCSFVRKSSVVSRQWSTARERPFVAVHYFWFFIGGKVSAERRDRK
jgi:hypothetical protein